MATGQSSDPDSQRPRIHPEQQLNRLFFGLDGIEAGKPPQAYRRQPPAPITQDRAFGESPGHRHRRPDRIRCCHGHRRRDRPSARAAAPGLFSSARRSRGSAGHRPSGGLRPSPLLPRFPPPPDEPPPPQGPPLLPAICVFSLVLARVITGSLVTCVRAVANQAVRTGCRIVTSSSAITG